jgi:hypothetical protein
VSIAGSYVWTFFVAVAVPVPFSPPSTQIRPPDTTDAAC